MTQPITVLDTSTATIAEAPETRTERDIALLKRLRAQVLELVTDSRAYSYDLSYEIGKIRELINKHLAYALLNRELESES